MTRALATTFIAAIALAAVPRALGAQTESSPAPLPEIGRTRATPAACAVMRDVVIPAFAASLRADAKFTAVRDDLPAYVQLKSDYRGQRVAVKSGGITLESQYAKLSTEVASLLQDTAAIRKLLDDPRLSAGSNDPAIKAERERLEELYAAQQARAAYLNQLMLRESTFLAKNTVGWEDPLAFANMHLERDPQHRPTPVMTAPPNMPVLTGFDASDRAKLDEWNVSQARLVHDSEERAAKTFMPFAQACR
jgi:hypothetical protein